MKILYAIVILLIAYTAFTVIRFKYTLSNAHLATIIQPEQTFGNGPAIRYIAAGDSTAVGEGASSVEHSYTYKVAQYLSASHAVQYKNVGVRGAQTNDVISDQLAQIINFKPDIITLSIGANDITHLRAPNTVMTNMRNILKTLTEQTDAQVYITDIPIVDKTTLLPLPYRKFLGYRVKKTNSQAMALESDRVHVIDIHNFGWDRYPDIETTFAKDRFHPNDEGYLNWTNAFVSRIKELYP